MSRKYICKECGFKSPKWAGRCTSCGSWESMELVDEEEEENSKVSKKAPKGIDVNKVDLQKGKERLSAGFDEFDRTLGGGFVQGQVVLIGGQPGIGKTTLLLQTLDNIVAQKLKGLYASAEESVEQVSLHAKRLDLRNEINIVSSSDIDRILATTVKKNYKYLIVDSIQTVKTEDLTGMPGAVSQVKECTSRIVEFAKKNGITVVLVGHITKEGNLAGPKVIEHLVDGVFYLESDKSNKIRILRSVKNRFGATSEIGVFQFEEGGFKDAKNPAEMFVLSSKPSIGICKGVVFEGRRAMIVEVQSLISKSGFSVAQRVVSGLKKSKIQMFCALLSKYSKASFLQKDVYVNIANGLKVKDPAMDLSICFSLLSSHYSKKVDPKMVAVGEVSLTGKLHVPSMIDQRLKTLDRLGYKKVILPSEVKGNKNAPSKAEFVDSISQIKELL